MKSILPWLDKNFEPIVIVALFYSVVTLITLQVILRFGFDSGFAWSEELSRFLFIWLMYFAFSYATRNNKHIRITYLLDKLTEKYKKIIMLIVDFLFIAFSIILFLTSIRITQSIIEYGNKAVTLNVSMNVVYGAAVVGFLLMTIRLLQQIIWKIKHYNSPIEMFETYKGTEIENESMILLNKK